MKEIQADSRLNILEVSGLAWAETVRRAAETLGNDAAANFAAYQASLPEQAVRSPETGDELRRAGILDAYGVMSPQWILAVALAASAPVKASAVVQFRDTAQFGDAVRPEERSVHTEIGLAGGRGVGVSYFRRINQQPDDEVVTEVRNAVEVSFFQEENAWASLSRHFPDLPELNASHEAAANASCTIHLDVWATPGTRTGARPYSSRRVWTVADRLYSVATGPGGTDAVSLTAVPATDLAREFAWSLLGAREYLGTLAGRSVSV